MAITATAIEPKKSPPAPGSSTSGMKAKTVVNVEDMSGMRMRDTAPFIASIGWSPLISRFLAEVPLSDVSIRKTWSECSSG